jgi:hypothetical protein
MNSLLKLIFDGGEIFASPFALADHYTPEALDAAHEALDDSNPATVAANDDQYALGVHLCSWA